MNKIITSGIASLIAIGTVLTSAPASAQWRDHDNRPGWNRDRDRDRDGRPDRWDRHDNRRPQYYGGRYGYRGYEGRWRAGQRYPHYRDSGYYINNYSSYGLPAPRRGYRYYRTDNGDIVMAAVASGVIGLIIGGALAR